MKHKLVKERPENEAEILQVVRDPSVAMVPTPIFKAKDIPPAAKIAYVALSQAIDAIIEARDEKRDLDITDSDVADFAGLSEEDYSDAIQFLVDYGLIEMERVDGMANFRIVRTHPIFIEGYIVKTTPEEAASRKRRF